MKYKIVSQTTIPKLVDRVNKLLKEGWELRGEFKSYATFNQAMTLEEPVASIHASRKIKYVEAYAEIEGYQEVCLHEGIKPGTITGISCPCPKCSPQC